MVLVEDAAQSLSLTDVQDNELGLLGARWWQRVQGSGIGDALMRSVDVVEQFVLARGVE